MCLHCAGANFRKCQRPGAADAPGQLEVCSPRAAALVRAKWQAAIHAAMDVVSLASFAQALVEARWYEIH